MQHWFIAERRFQSAIIGIGLLLVSVFPSQQAHAASGSVKCGGKTYTASVSGGSCKVGANWVSCTGSNPDDKAQVSCLNNPNPCTSSGEGSCKSELTVNPGNPETPNKFDRGKVLMPGGTLMK